MLHGLKNENRLILYSGKLSKKYDNDAGVVLG